MITVGEKKEYEKPEERTDVSRFIQKYSHRDRKRSKKPRRMRRKKQ